MSHFIFRFLSPFSYLFRAAESSLPKFLPWVIFYYNAIDFYPRIVSEVASEEGCLLFGKIADEDI